MICVIRRRGEASADLKSEVKNSMSGCVLFSRGATAAAAAARASRVLREFKARRRPLHTSLQSRSFAKELFLGNIEQVRGKSGLPLFSAPTFRWYPAGVGWNVI